MHWLVLSAGYCFGLRPAWSQDGDQLPALSATNPNMLWLHSSLKPHITGCLFLLRVMGLHVNVSLKAVRYTQNGFMGKFFPFCPSKPSFALWASKESVCIAACSIHARLCWDVRPLPSVFNIFTLPDRAPIRVIIQSTINTMLYSKESNFLCFSLLGKNRITGIANSLNATSFHVCIFSV